MLSSLAHGLAVLLLVQEGSFAAGSTSSSVDLCSMRRALTCVTQSFQAFTVCSALTAGLLNTTFGGSMDEHFGHFDVFSACGAGAWWITSTLYSAEIPDMLEQMAASPSEAGNIFLNAWLSKLPLDPYTRRLRVFDVDLDRLRDSTLCPSGGFQPLPPDAMFPVFVQGPTSIPDGATLSLKPNRSSAEGRLVVITGSVPSPGSNGAEDEKVWVHFTYSNVTANEVNGSIYYTANSSKSGAFPLWVPVRWNFRLGDDADAYAPLPFCGDADCNGLFLEYTGYSQDSGDSFTTASPFLGEIFGSAFMQGAGSVLMDKVVAASSSSTAATAILEPAAQDGAHFPNDTLAQTACIPLATWVDSSPSWGMPFSPEDSQITEELIQNIALSGLQGLSDGFMTDPTGVAAALSALTSGINCTEDRNLNLSITAMLNGNESEITFLQTLFPGAGYVRGPICSSPTSAEVLELLERDPVLPNFATQYLISINSGTIECETVDNPWYGIKGGFHVDIHFIWARQNEVVKHTPTSLADFVWYIGLAREIALAMVNHTETPTTMESPTDSPSTTDGDANSTTTDGDATSATTDGDGNPATTDGDGNPATTDGDANSATSFVLLPFTLLISVFVSTSEAFVVH